MSRPEPSKAEAEVEAILEEILQDQEGSGSPVGSACVKLSVKDKELEAEYCRQSRA